MTDPPTPATKAPRPSPINGPAFLVFGMMFVILGLSIDGVILFSVMGISLALIGVAAIIWQRRYEKAAGIEEVLPGRLRTHDKSDATDD